MISLVVKGITITPVIIEFDERRVEKAILHFKHLVTLLSKSLCLPLHQAFGSQEILVVETKDDDGYNKDDEKNHSEYITSLRHIM
jgi:hypothetical protein